MPGRLVIQNVRLHHDRPAPASPARVALAELAHDSIDVLSGPDATKLRMVLRNLRQSRTRRAPTDESAPHEPGQAETR
jgi:hypothetical protein